MLTDFIRHILRDRSNAMKTIAIYNVKGGVGKTTSCVNLAAFSARDGYQTLVWDMDPQGAASFYLGEELIEVRKAEKVLKDKKQFISMVRETRVKNLSIAPAFFNLRNMDIIVDDEKKVAKKLGKVLEKISKTHEFLFIDCPPSISALSEMIFTISDLLVIPVIPTVLSMQSLEQVRDHLSTIRSTARLLAFFTMVDSRKKMHRDIMESKDSDPGVLHTSIAYRSVVEQMGVHQLPLPEFAPDANETIAYSALWKELQHYLDAPISKSGY